MGDDIGLYIASNGQQLLYTGDQKNGILIKTEMQIEQNNTGSTNLSIRSDFYGFRRWHSSASEKEMEDNCECAAVDSNLKCTYRPRKNIARRAILGPKYTNPLIDT